MTDTTDRFNAVWQEDQEVHDAIVDFATDRVIQDREVTNQSLGDDVSQYLLHFVDSEKVGEAVRDRLDIEGVFR